MGILFLREWFPDVRSRAGSECVAVEVHLPEFISGMKGGFYISL